MGWEYPHNFITGQGTGHFQFAAAEYKNRHGVGPAAAYEFS